MLYLVMFLPRILQISGRQILSFFILEMLSEVCPLEVSASAVW